MPTTMGETKQQSESGRSGNGVALWACLGILGSLVIAAALYVYFSADPVVAKYRDFVQFYTSRKEVKAFLASFGPYAPIPFIVLQSLQVVFAPIPGEATGFLGGYVFGTWLGFLYSSIGLTLGSAAAFGLGRWLGSHVVRRLVSDAVYHKFDFVARTGGELVTLLFFLIPGFPKDYLCFLLGVSSTFGRLPGTWLLSIQGAKVRGAHYWEFLIFLAVAATAALLAYNYRETILQWLHRRHRTRAGQDAPRATQPPP
ncbi:MAG: associated Golgi protein-like protein [candidate division NC10 bacterium]|nr:associated Golgi protein-like protein [candidate division NC10 bacterium]